MKWEETIGLLIEKGYKHYEIMDMTFEQILVVKLSISEYAKKMKELAENNDNDEYIDTADNPINEVGAGIDEETFNKVFENI